MLKRLIVSGSLLLLNGCLFGALTIAPARQEIRMPPGAVYIGTFTVTSDYEVPAMVTSSCSDWYHSLENKGIMIDQWLKVYPSSFTLNPGESKTANYQVTVPQSAKGEMVAMVSFHPDIGNMNGVSLLISSALYVIVAGTDKYDWNVSKTKIFKNIQGKLQAEAFIRNKGNVHVRPVGMTQVVTRNKKKEVVVELKYREGRPAYPGDEKQMVTYGDFTLKPGKYTAVTKMRYGSMVREKKVNFIVIVNDKGETVIK